MSFGLNISAEWSTESIRSKLKKRKVVLSSFSNSSKEIMNTNHCFCIIWCKFHKVEFFDNLLVHYDSWLKSLYITLVARVMLRDLY